MSRLIAPLFLVPPPHDCPMFISPPRLPPFFPPLFCSRLTKRHDPHPRGDTVVMNAPRHIHHIISAYHHPLSRSSIAQLFPLFRIAHLSVTFSLGWKWIATYRPLCAVSAPCVGRLVAQSRCQTRFGGCGRTVARASRCGDGAPPRAHLGRILEFHGRHMTGADWLRRAWSGEKMGGEIPQGLSSGV